MFVVICDCSPRKLIQSSLSKEIKWFLSGYVYYLEQKSVEGGQQKPLGEARAREDY